MKPVYSFDVFDTCLCRLCGEPRLLFDVLSLKVQQAADEHFSEHMRQLFVATRATADGNSLTEIYKNVAEQYPLPISVEKMVQLELDTERQLLVPIQETIQQVNRLREKGDILFISDMYLPSDFIRGRLIEHGFFREGDRLYVSDELQAWKHNGTLYQLIHEKEGIPFRQWHHYGDNRKSDYSVPRRLGIHAHYLHYDYLPYEEQWRQKPVIQYQFPAILAGVARAVRLSSNAPDDQKSFVCNVTAPLMVSWVLQIMNDAQLRGIRRLYFCARDMHSHYHIALSLRTFFPNLDIKYLFISGPALYNSPKCIDYLFQEGLCDNTPSAIVDSCSSGKTIREMNHILSSNGYRPISGYFWAKMSIAEEPCADESFMLDSDYLTAMTNGKVKRLIGMRILYELLFSINFHSKTIDYSETHNMIRPVFGKDTDDHFSFNNGKKPRENKKNNDSLLLHFTNGILATGLHSFHHDILHHIIIPQLIEYANYPNKKYLNYLHQFLWWDRPFVGALFGKKKGVWKRGNIFFCLPNFFATPLRSILSDDRKRRRINHILTWHIHN